MTATSTPKVFCIGFQKTGTTSMAVALRKLGYRVTGPNGHKDPDIATNLDDLVLRVSQEYDAFQDNPWPLVYRRMDALYPGSRFILTVRDSESWIKSAVKHFGDVDRPMLTLVYEGVGHPKGNEAHYVERMERHNREVAEYFRDRPDDLLTIDLTAGGGWEPICRFLGKPVPAEPFPHAHTEKARAKRRLRDKYGFLGRVIGRFWTPKARA